MKNQELENKHHPTVQAGGLLELLERGLVALSYGLPTLQVHLGQEGHGHGVYLPTGGSSVTSGDSQTVRQSGQLGQSQQ